MILCPECGLPLNKKSCRCGFKLVKQNGVYRLAAGIPLIKPGYSEEGHIVLNSCEEKHFWFVIRRRLISEAVKRYLKPGSSVFDAGCGTGRTAMELSKAGFKLSAGDIFEPGLRLSASRIQGPVYQTDISDLPFREHFDSVCAFDVIEHFKDDIALMKTFHSALKPGGIIFLTVPAYQFLWSRGDTEGGHARRYSRKKVRNLLRNAGFEPLEIRYFYLFILPLLFLRKLLLMFSPSGHKSTETGTAINAAVNAILMSAARFEHRIFRRSGPPAGGSILAAGKKIEEQ